MIRHLTPADYTAMPWANGRGTTIELLRRDGPQGLLWRLSMATVAEDGPFSIFPGIERNLTVISGPGFTLGAQQAAPFEPIAFPGDQPLAASGVSAPSEDFNVMTARHLPRPEVAVIRGRASLAAGPLAIFALQPMRAQGRALGRHDLLLAEEALQIDGFALALRLPQP